MTKDTILFINRAPQDVSISLREHGKKNKTRYRIAVLRDTKYKIKNKNDDLHVDAVVTCDLKSQLKVAKALAPYEDRLLAITCRAEMFIPYFVYVIPNVPYLRTPTTASLIWSIDKIMMRRRMRAYDKTLVPRFTIAKDARKETIEKIENKVGFPLILKPAGLAQSLLVSICYHEEELQENLNKIFRKIRRIYKENDRNAEPQVLVEQFMDGEMYSIDAYVNTRGKAYMCPLVHIKTGRSIGFDDFFGYQQMTPTSLKKSTTDAAEEVAEKAIHALGLRNSTVHIELMRMERGWKVIELGPRVGGFRQSLYKLAYGFDHGLNDILIRIPEKPIIKKKNKAHAAAFKFYARKEGTLTELTGIQKIRKLSSFVEIKVNKKVGDKCKFAKHGGKSVCDVVLCNTERSKLLADIRRLEKTLVIKVKNGRA